jgi:hypothetical protein
MVPSVSIRYKPSGGSSTGKVGAATVAALNAISSSARARRGIVDPTRFIYFSSSR